MSDRFDIDIIRGEPFISTITTTTSGVNCPPFDLTNYNVSGGIRYRYLDFNLVDFSIDMLSPLSSGVVTINLTKEQTSGLPITECIHYVKAIPNFSGEYVDLLNGYARINPL